MAVAMRERIEPVAAVTIETTNLTTEEPDAAILEYAPPEEMLIRFAEVIYTYDTRERRFYEGAQPYMTEAGYQMLVPLSAGEEREDRGEEEVHPAVISNLNQVSFYYKDMSEGSKQALMEAAFSLSRSGNAEIIQYTKLFIIKMEDGWMIDNYEPVDTIER